MSKAARDRRAGVRHRASRCWRVSVWSGHIDSGMGTTLGIWRLPGSVHLFLSGHFAQRLSVLFGVFDGEIPGEQFVDPADRVFGDTGQDLAKVALWVESVQLSRSDQRVDGSSTHAAGVGASEQVILSPQSESPDILPMSVRN